MFLLCSIFINLFAPYTSFGLRERSIEVDNIRREYQYKRNQWLDNIEKLKTNYAEQLKKIENVDSAKLNNLFLSCVSIGYFDGIVKALSLGANIFSRSNHDIDGIGLIIKLTKEFRDLGFDKDIQTKFFSEYRKILGLLKYQMGLKHIFKYDIKILPNEIVNLIGQYGFEENMMMQNTQELDESNSCVIV